jgi:hypothetical protein
VHQGQNQALSGDRLVGAAAGASDKRGNDDQDDAHADRDVAAYVVVALPVGGIAGEERGQRLAREGAARLLGFAC